MRKIQWLMLLCLLALCAGVARADESFTGTLGVGQTGDTCSDVYAASCVYQLNFNLASPTSITIQSWGFGGTNGGKNAAGNVINSGGFDELIALFSGTGSGATLIDGSADVLGNYGSYVGCPPAGNVTIGTGAGSSVCGDLTMNFSLAAGNYTLTLSDAAYQPNALTGINTVTGLPYTTLGDGFSDLTGGVFQTCNFISSGTYCITPTADWAFDLKGVSPSAVPEPGTLLLVGTGLLGLARMRKRRSGAA